jgi:hypothetical protein
VPVLPSVLMSQRQLCLHRLWVGMQHTRASCRVSSCQDICEQCWSVVVDGTCRSTNSP